MPARPQFNQSNQIQRAADLIRNAKKGVALTGAGFSTPSGIPDFRTSTSGIWNNVDPMEVASLTAFRRNPQKVYRWLRPFVKKILDAKPNPAHKALSQLGAAGHFQAVITQNIDGLHQRAGSEEVYEVHGSFASLTCTRCFTQYKGENFVAPFVKDGMIPICPKCSGILKPDAIFFEEQLPYQTWQLTEKALANADLMLVGGSSLIVMPVAGLPLKAVNNHIPLIIVNKTPTYMDPRAEIVISGDVAEVLPRLLKEVLGE